MKNLILASLFLFPSASAGAQGAPRTVPVDPSITRQADSLKQLYIKAGYVIVKENPVAMESQYEFPVIVPLKAGTPYQFVFIGEMSSRMYEVRMYDWAEKQVFYKKHMWGDIDGNIIAYPYVARQDEYHLLKVLQVNKVKKKDISGYVMMFRRTHSPIELEEAQKALGIQPAAAPATPVATAPAPATDSTKKKKNNYDQYLEN